MLSYESHSLCEAHIKHFNEQLLNYAYHKLAEWTQNFVVGIVSILDTQTCCAPAAETKAPLKLTETLIISLAIQNAWNLTGRI